MADPKEHNQRHSDDITIICGHELRSWRETSFTSGGWNISFFCLLCGEHLSFGRFSDVIVGAP